MTSKLEDAKYRIEFNDPYYDLFRPCVLGWQLVGMFPQKKDAEDFIRLSSASPLPTAQSESTIAELDPLFPATGVEIEATDGNVGRKSDVAEDVVGRARQIIADEEELSKGDDKADVRLYALRLARVHTAKQIIGEKPMTRPDLLRIQEQR